jgi:uncharacterized C2H2 Zn-finger protein
MQPKAYDVLIKTCCMEAKYGICIVCIDLADSDQMKRDTKSTLSCPQCDSTIVYRTKRKGILERIILYPLGYRAYRCEICDMRFRYKPKL